MFFIRIFMHFLILIFCNVFFFNIVVCFRLIIFCFVAALFLFLYSLARQQYLLCGFAIYIYMHVYMYFFSLALFLTRLSIIFAFFRPVKFFFPLSFLSIFQWYLFLFKNFFHIFFVLDIFVFFFFFLQSFLVSSSLPPSLFRPLLAVLTLLVLFFTNLFPHHILRCYFLLYFA